MHSEVADVTGNVKYIGKNIFGTKTWPHPQIFICWAQPPLIPYSAAYVKKDNKLLFFFFAMSMLFYDCVQLTLS